MQLDSYQIISSDDAKAILVELDGMEWFPGQAKSEAATKALKHNFEIRIGESENATRLLKSLQTTISKNQGLLDDHILNKVMTPKFSRTLKGGGYDRHGDSAIMLGELRTDLAFTLFLSDPSDYEGGELCIEEAGGRVSQVKGSPGTCVVYECHNPHWVNTVTSGERIIAVTWLESKVRDISQRALVRRLTDVCKDIEADSSLAYTNIHSSVGSVQGKLLRMWMD